MNGVFLITGRRYRRGSDGQTDVRSYGRQVSAVLDSRAVRPGLRNVVSGVVFKGRRGDRGSNYGNIGWISFSTHCSISLHRYIHHSSNAMHTLPMPHTLHFVAEVVHHDRSRLFVLSLCLLYRVPLLLAPYRHAKSSSSLRRSMLDASAPQAKYERMKVVFKRAPAVSSLLEDGGKGVESDGMLNLAGWEITTDGKWCRYRH